MLSFPEACATCGGAWSFNHICTDRDDSGAWTCANCGFRGFWSGLHRCQDAQRLLHRRPLDLLDTSYPRPGQEEDGGGDPIDDDDE